MQDFSGTSRRSVVDPLQPRVAQGVTGALAILAIALGSPWPLVAALALVVLALLAPRWSPVAWAVRRLGPPPRELEPIAPVRFSQILAVVFLGLSLVLWGAGLVVIAMAVAGLVAGLAALSALTGVCVGCEVHRLAFAVRRGGGDLRSALGLEGGGPWLVVLTAPGCARCEPTARRVERAAPDRAVVRVNLAEQPAASAAPVRSVPAVLAIDQSGAVLAARTGPIGDQDLASILATLEPGALGVDLRDDAPAPA